MKTIIKILVIFLFCLKLNGQNLFFTKSFIYNNSKIEYLTTGSLHHNGNFYVIIKNEIKNNNEFYENLNKCLKSKKTLEFDCYYLIIPKEFSYEKEKLILEFINYILGKLKLYESEMNIISDGNYFSLYEQTKLKNDTYRHNLIEMRKEIARNKKSNPKFVKKGDSVLLNKIDYQKYSHLNKISSLTILKEKDNFCNYIK